VDLCYVGYLDSDVCLIRNSPETGKGVTVRANILESKLDTDIHSRHRMYNAYLHRSIQMVTFIPIAPSSDVTDSTFPFVGITPTGEKLEILLLDYLLKLEQAKAEKDAGYPQAMQQIKPVNFLVITGKCQFLNRGVNLTGPRWSPDR
jgi:hypothetical protein